MRKPIGTSPHFVMVPSVNSWMLITTIYLIGTLSEACNKGNELESFMSKD
jgi:hypothetical protein